MKEGAGEDPFGDDADGEDPFDDADRATDTDRTGERSAGPADRERTVHIPYKFRRDGVQDDRDRVPLFLMADTKRAERDAQRELETRFDEDVALTDLREALVKAGLENLGDAEAALADWGYGVTTEK